MSVGVTLVWGWAFSHDDGGEGGDEMAADNPPTPDAHDADTTDDDALIRRQRWSRLPDRPDPGDYVETQSQDPPPSVSPAAGDPDTNWMLRHSG